MRKLVLGLFAISVMSISSFANCKYEEGDDITIAGKYLWADRCKIIGTVEKVNKKCTKVKMSVGKVTGAFGLRINDKCRFNGGQAVAGQRIWVKIK